MLHSFYVNAREAQSVCHMLCLRWRKYEYIVE